MCVILKSKDKLKEDCPVKLNDDVAVLKGVGPKKAEALARLQIQRLEDLLNCDL